jgi:hypothetical protein
MAPFRRANIVYVSIPNARGFFRPLMLEQWMLISNDTEKIIHYYILASCYAEAVSNSIKS